MSSTLKQIILIALSVLLVVLFLFLPEKPVSIDNSKTTTEKMAEDTESSSKALSVDERISDAIKKVKGAAPMAGILELKAIADEDPSQVDAQYFLGVSSIQIGELEKAVNRFEKVITFAGLKKYPDTRLRLAECYEGLGSNEKAIEQLEAEIKDDNSSLLTIASEQLERLRN